MDLLMKVWMDLLMDLLMDLSMDWLIEMMDLLNELLMDLLMDFVAWIVLSLICNYTIGFACEMTKPIEWIDVLKMNSNFIVFRDESLARLAAFFFLDRPIAGRAVTCVQSFGDGSLNCANFGFRYQENLTNILILAI